MILPIDFGSQSILRHPILLNGTCESHYGIPIVLDLYLMVEDELLPLLVERGDLGFERGAGGLKGGMRSFDGEELFREG